MNTHDICLEKEEKYLPDTHSHPDLCLFLHENTFLGIHWKCLTEAFLMSNYNIFSRAQLFKANDVVS